MNPAPRNILVSGASKGIGHAICRRLLKAGHQVIGLARDLSGFAAGATAFHGVEVDLGNLETLPGRLQEITTRFPELDGAICCAGAGRFGSLEEFSYRQIRELVDLNLLSQIYVARALLPGLKKQGRGDLVLMGSEAALTAGRRGAVYSATKFGLRGLAQALRQECAGSGVRVCIINPGMVDTDFFTGLEFRPGEAEDEHLVDEDVAAAVIAVLDTRQGAVIDEINLSPQKKVVRFGAAKKQD